jgi:prepilin-type N-terminal cleavage/methylation domain-containing protein
MRRSGFTLIEILVAVVVMGLMVLIGLPRIREMFIQSNVLGSRRQVVNTYLRARSIAVEQNRRAIMKLDANRLLVVTRPRKDGTADDGIACDTVVKPQRLDSLFKVSATAGGGSVDSITVDPRGFGTGLANDFVVTLTRGSLSKTVTISGLGRVQ